MLEQQQTQHNFHASSLLNKLKNPKFILIITIIFIALAIAIIWILSSLGRIPSYWATALSISSTVIGIIIAILPSISASHEKTTLHVIDPSITPVLINTHTAPLLSDILPAPPTAIHHGMAGLPPPTNARAIQQRQEEVESIYERVIQPDTSAIVLTGIGGIGKSTLAALIYRHAEIQRCAGIGPFTAPALWLRVDPAMTMVDLIGTLFELIDKPLLDFNAMFPQDQVMRLFSLLNTISKPRLIVIDQFENWLDWQTGNTLTNRPGIGEWLDAINSQPCRCRILLTSRPWPKGTREYPPLYMQEYSVRGLTVAEGLDLLRKQDVKGTDTELQKAVEYCSGHAFALILLALLIRNHNLNLSTLFLDATFTQLWEGNIARNLLDNVYKQQLNQLQRGLLGSFSVFREPVLLEAACAILEMESGTSKIQNALHVVLEQHLLKATGNGYYQLHTIVTNYAQSHFDENDEQINQQILRTAHRKASAYYLRQAAAACPPKDQRRQINDIHPLLESVWQSCQAQQWQEAYDLMEHEDIFSALKRWGGNATLLELCQILLQSKHWSMESPQLACLYNNLGDIYRVWGQIEQAKHYYNQTLQICRQLPDPVEEGWARNNLGQIYNTSGNSEQAQIYLEQALQLFRTASHRLGEGKSITNLGWLYYDRGNLQQAQQCFEQALGIFNAENDRREEGFAYGYLGRVHDDMGYRRLAQQYYAQALQILHEIGDHNGEGIMLCNLGRVYNYLEQRELALEYLEQALKMLKEVGDRSNEGTALNDLGKVYANMGQAQLAQQYLEQALLIRREVGNRRGEVRALTDLGKLYADLGQMEQAQTHFKQALQVRKKIEHGWREGRTLKNLGQVHSLLGANDLALQYYMQALHSYQHLDNPWEENMILFELGLLYIKHQQYDLALPFFILAQSADQQIEDTHNNKIQEQIALIASKIDRANFSSLLANTTPQLKQMVKKTLENIEH